MSDKKQSDNQYGYQNSIISDATKHAAFLSVFLRDGLKIEDILHIVGSVPHFVDQAHQTANSNRNSKEDFLDAIVSISPKLTRSYFGESKVPQGLLDYQEITGPGGKFPSTGGDLFLHIKSNREDLMFILSKLVADEMQKSELLQKLEEVTGFLYLQGANGLARDLTGFEDGTANPKTFDQKLEAAIIREGEHKGGSFIIAQKWIHDLDEFNKLPVENQEKVFGRTKSDSKKLKDMLPESHVAQIDLKGMKILRHSMPYGDQKEHGLFFLGYANDTHKFDAMLKKMVELPQTMHSMMKYITAVSGQYYYVPSSRELESFVRK